MTGEERTEAALRCPVHDMPDCSRLLNGCCLINALDACHPLDRTDIAQAIEGVADTYTPEGVEIWWASWLNQGPVKRRRLLLDAQGYGGMVAT